ncbi:hypothetical protein Hypma_002109 [Hypsizygus marmoreus]|uniref:Uncharacterized protein n=1 Tax=Hypsizygus marmoreus TaxID=39966 RepID=A0A369K023_HYPMA|nr:hypothetical protein Hypma_002109 [Hypsizygus marmoreus]
MPFLLGRSSELRSRRPTTPPTPTPLQPQFPEGPVTPVRSAQATQGHLAALQDTHPVSDPPTPTFHSSLSHRQRIRRENAIILSPLTGAMVQLAPPGLDDEPTPSLFVDTPVHTVTIGASTFFEVDDIGLGRGIENTGWEVQVPSFNPQELVTHRMLWARVHSWGPDAGLDDPQFTQFSARCVLCDRFMTDRSKDYHECPQLTFENALLRRDAQELFRIFSDFGGHGIDSVDFQYLFVRHDHDIEMEN